MSQRMSQRIMSQRYDSRAGFLFYIRSRFLQRISSSFLSLSGYSRRREHVDYFTINILSWTVNLLPFHATVVTIIPTIATAQPSQWLSIPIPLVSQSNVNASPYPLGHRYHMFLRVYEQLTVLAT